MMICECLGLTDRGVRKKIEQGACSLNDLVPKSALEGSCGACFNHLQKMISEYREASEAEASSSKPSDTFSSLSV